MWWLPTAARYAGHRSIIKFYVPIASIDHKSHASRGCIRVHIDIMNCIKCEYIMKTPIIENGSINYKCIEPESNPEFQFVRDSDNSMQGCHGTQELEQNLEQESLISISVTIIEDHIININTTAIECLWIFTHIHQAHYGRRYMLCCQPIH